MIGPDIAWEAFHATENYTQEREYWTRVLLGFGVARDDIDFPGADNEPTPMTLDEAKEAVSKYLERI